VVYVDAAQILDGPDGEYSTMSRDGPSDTVVTRDPVDGFHLTAEGSRILGLRVVIAIGTGSGLPTTDDATTSTSWAG
jgi:hypothetical protein